MDLEGRRLLLPLLLNFVSVGIFSDCFMVVEYLNSRAVLDSFEMKGRLV